MTKEQAIAQAKQQAEEYGSALQLIHVIGGDYTYDDIADFDRDDARSNAVFVGAVTADGRYVDFEGPPPPPMRLLPPAPTLRDQFAMAAMGGLLTRKWLPKNGNSIETAMAIEAYEMADAMLAARSAPTPE